MALKLIILGSDSVATFVPADPAAPSESSADRQSQDEIGCTFVLGLRYSFN